LYFEEFNEGQKFQLDPIQVTKEDIFTYAHEYDPQPIHIDEQFANESIFGGIIASGFQTVSLVWSQWIQKRYFGDQIVGGVGMDNLLWKRPVYPNDVLSTTVEVISKKAFPEKKRGLIELTFTIVNQDEKIVTTFAPKVFIKMKDGNKEE
jgi:acyl dehydratase